MQIWHHNNFSTASVAQCLGNIAGHEASRQRHRMQTQSCRNAEVCRVVEASQVPVQSTSGSLHRNVAQTMECQLVFTIVSLQSIRRQLIFATTATSHDDRSFAGRGVVVIICR